MKYWLFCIAICVFISCSEKGPCDYEIVSVEADVINIIPYTKNNKELFHVELKFNASSLYDGTHYLDDLKNIEIDSAFINRNKIRKGQTYTATVSDLISGSCTQRIISFNQALK